MSPASVSSSNCNKSCPRSFITSCPQDTKISASIFLTIGTVPLVRNNPALLRNNLPLLRDIVPL